jgi:CRP/FNR family cyclic AMP-dependent transcriptional regulator
VRQATKVPFTSVVGSIEATVGRTIVTYAANDVVFTQGAPSRGVIFLKTGGIRLSVLSYAGQDAVIATLGPGDFFGEGALSGHSVRTETARAIIPSTVFFIPKRQMMTLLHRQPGFSNHFLEHMLTRNASLQADVLDLLFNSGEERLARALLLLAHYGHGTAPQLLSLPVSQQTLAETVGTTRSRINMFLNKFRRLGFIDYDADALTINPSLLSVVARNGRRSVQS